MCVFAVRRVCFEQLGHGTEELEASIVLLEFVLVIAGTPAAARDDTPAASSKSGTLLC